MAKKNKIYKLDRNTFKAMTVEEASDHASYYKTLSWQERFRIAIYLNSIAFKLVGLPEPRLDKTLFRTRSRN